MNKLPPLQQAFLLHKRPYRNTSTIIECFTKQDGRISLVAKGAQRPKSPWIHLLSPFTCLELSYVGHSELKTVTHLGIAGPPIWLSGSALLSGLYLNELLLHLLPQQEPCTAIFEDFQAVVHSLQVDELIEPSLRFFEKGVLQDLGFLALDVDASDSHTIVEEGRYWLDQEGGVVNLKAKKCIDPHLKGVSGRTLLALAQETTLDKSALLESKVFLRAVIQKALGDKRLKSPLIWRQK